MDQVWIQAGPKGMLALIYEWGLISKLLWRAFSWHPWIPSTLKLHSTSSLFKCEGGISIYIHIERDRDQKFSVTIDIKNLLGCLKKKSKKKLFSPSYPSLYLPYENKRSHYSATVSFIRFDHSQEQYHSSNIPVPPNCFKGRPLLRAELTHIRQYLRRSFEHFWIEFKKLNTEELVIVSIKSNINQVPLISTHNVHCTSTVRNFFSQGISFRQLGSDSSSGYYQGSFKPSTTSESYVSPLLHKKQASSRRVGSVPTQSFLAG